MYLKPNTKITERLFCYSSYMTLSFRSSISKNRAGDLLDLSSGDNRNNTPNNVEGVFNQQQHQQAGTEQGKKVFRKSLKIKFSKSIILKATYIV